MLPTTKRYCRPAVLLAATLGVAPLAAATGGAWAKLPAPKPAAPKSAAKPAAKPTVAPPAVIAPAAEGAHTDYYGVFMQNAKLGSAVMIRDDKASLDGRPAVRVDMTMTMDLRVLGAPNTVLSKSVSWTDPKTGAPLGSESRSEAAGRVTTVSARYTDRAVTYTADIQGTRKTETLTLAPGERFLADPTEGAVKPAVGMVMKGKTFIGDLMKLVDSEIRVVGQETIAIDGQAVRAYKIEQKSLMPATLWTTENGDALRADLPMGMQMRKLPKAVALASPTGKAPDIALLSSIAPTGVALTPEARKASSITYEIAGVTRALAPDNTVQTVSYAAPTASVGGAKTATVTVFARPLPDAAGVSRFATSDAAPERLRRFLQSTPYVPATDAEFVSLARQIVGDETDTAKAAAKISAYVTKTMTPDPGIAALRTAHDIRKQPRGVCRDYTTFYTAIARAAGVPTKQCVGLGYGVLPDGGGRFVGHAWPEVWVGTDADGRDKWIALEPTWGQSYADGTHIKMAEGEITDFYQVAADLSAYKIKVVEVKKAEGK